MNSEAKSWVRCSDKLHDLAAKLNDACDKMVSWMSKVKFISNCYSVIYNRIQNDLGLPFNESFGKQVYFEKCLKFYLENHFALLLYSIDSLRLLKTGNSIDDMIRISSGNCVIMSDNSCEGFYHQQRTLIKKFKLLGDGCFDQNFMKDIKRKLVAEHLSLNVDRISFVLNDYEQELRDIIKHIPVMLHSNTMMPYVLTPGKETLEFRVRFRETKDLAIICSRINSNLIMDNNIDVIIRLTNNEVVSDEFGCKVASEVCQLMKTNRSNKSLVGDVTIQATNRLGNLVPPCILIDENSMKRDRSCLSLSTEEYVDSECEWDSESDF
jgi:hypothetical protein